MITATTHPLIRSAARHVYAAADQCAQHAGPDPLSPWLALAAQMRLVAAGLAPDADSDHPTVQTLSVSDHLIVALEILHAVPASQGPADLQVWQWRVVDLRDLVTAWDQAS